MQEVSEFAENLFGLSGTIFGLSKQPLNIADLGEHVAV